MRLQIHGARGAAGVASRNAAPMMAIDPWLPPYLRLVVETAIHPITPIKKLPHCGSATRPGDTAASLATTDVA